MRLIFIYLINAYRYFISPLFPQSCRFTPTCSEYAMEAIDRFGVFGGGVMALWRLLRCHPFSRGGYDPVGFDLPFGSWMRRKNSLEKVSDSGYPGAFPIRGKEDQDRSSEN